MFIIVLISAKTKQIMLPILIGYIQELWLVVLGEGENVNTGNKFSR